MLASPYTVSANMLLYSKGTFTKLSDLPAGFTSGNSSTGIFSYDMVYFMTQTSNTAYSLYKRNGDVFSLVNTITTPSGGSYSMTFDATHAAVAGSNSSPYVYIYSLSTFTRIATNVSLSYYQYNMIYSPDGAHLVIGQNSSGLVAYKRVGDTYTLIATPPSVSAYSYCTPLGFSPDGLYIACLGIYTNTWGYLGISYRSPSDDYISRLNVACVYYNNTAGWSPDSVYLSFITGVETYMYKRTGSGATATFATITFPAWATVSTSNNSPFSPSWSPDGLYLYIAAGSYNGVAQTVITYQRSGDTFTKITTPAILTNTANNIQTPRFVQYRGS
jgi:hypothetical protein